MGGYRGGRWLTYVCSRQGLLASLQKAATERLLFKKLGIPFFKVISVSGWCLKHNPASQGSNVVHSYIQGKVFSSEGQNSSSVWSDLTRLPSSVELKLTPAFVLLILPKLRWSGAHTHTQRFLQETASLCQRSIIACFSRLTHSWVDMKPVVLVKAFRLTDWRAECEKHLEVNISVRTVTSG